MCIQDSSPDTLRSGAVGPVGPSDVLVTDGLRVVREPVTVYRVRSERKGEANEPRCVWANDAARALGHDARVVGKALRAALLEAGRSDGILSVVVAGWEVRLARSGAHVIASWSHGGADPRLALDGAVVPFATLNPVRNRRGVVVDFTWTYISPAAARLLGAGRVGRRLLDDPDGALSVELFGRYVDVLRDGEPWEGEVQYDVGGTVTSTKQVASRSGDTIAVTWTDLTRLRRAEEALHEGERRKDAFLATLAHELRNPLAPIRMATDLLQDEPAASRIHERARDVLDRQASALTRLVEDLLEVSRLRRRMITLDRAPVGLDALMAEVLALVRSAAETYGHELIVEGLGTDVVLDVDAPRVTRALTAILHNAVRFTPRGGRVHVQLEARAGALVVRVRDHGIGIAAEDLAVVFEPFVQTAAGRAVAPGGLGCGLALAREVVELHGGAVHAWSCGPGAGSTFVVVLPIPTTDATRRGGRTQRIVWIGPEPGEGGGILAELASAGHTVRCAVDAREARELVRSFAPEVVLVDVDAVEGDGLVAALRASGAERAVFVAHGRDPVDDDRRRSRAAGFVDHLAMRLEPGVVAAVIAEHVGRRRERSPVARPSSPSGRAPRRGDGAGIARRIAARSGAEAEGGAEAAEIA